MEIKAVSSENKTDIGKIVSVHMETFTGFFLTFMGRGFLKSMYSSYCQHGDSELLAAYDGEILIGFLAWSADMSGLYKFMIKKKLIPFAWYSLGAFFRKPKVFMRLIRAFLKPGESERAEAYVELASIGVDPSVKSRGVGSALIDELKTRVDFSKYEYITLETDADNNEAANRFYQKNGFVLERTYETNEGRRMNEYRWRAEA